jgi:hypothetical protein
VLRGGGQGPPLMVVCLEKGGGVCSGRGGGDMGPCWGYDHACVRAL